MVDRCTYVKVLGVNIVVLALEVLFRDEYALYKA